MILPAYLVDIKQRGAHNSTAKKELFDKLSRSLVTVKYWEPSNTVRNTHHGGIFNFDFSTDGSCVVAACEMKNLLMFDPLSHKLIGSKENAHTDCVNCVRFLDSRTFVTCSDDTTIALWDLRYLKSKIRTLRGHSKWVKNIEYSSKQDLLMSSGFDGSIYTWDINNYSRNSSEGKEIFHTNGLMRSKLSPDDSKLIISTVGGYLMVVHNLDLTTLDEDLKGFQPNSYRLMQESQFVPKKGCTNQRVFHRKRNRVELIEDFPVGNNPHMISSLQIHPQGWCALSRNSNADESSEWSCVHDIQSDEKPSDFDDSDNSDNDDEDENGDRDHLSFESEKKKLTSSDFLLSITMDGSGAEPSTVSRLPHAFVSLGRPEDGRHIGTSVQPQGENDTMRIAVTPHQVMDDLSHIDDNLVQTGGSNIRLTGGLGSSLSISVTTSNRAAQSNQDRLPQTIEPHSSRRNLTFVPDGPVTLHINRNAENLPSLNVSRADMEIYREVSGRRTSIDINIYNMTNTQSTNRSRNRQTSATSRSQNESDTQSGDSGDVQNANTSVSQAGSDTQSETVESSDNSVLQAGSDIQSETVQSSDTSVSHAGSDTQSETIQNSDTSVSHTRSVTQIGNVENSDVSSLQDDRGGGISEVNTSDNAGQSDISEHNESDNSESHVNSADSGRLDLNRQANSSSDSTEDNNYQEMILNPVFPNDAPGPSSTTSSSNSSVSSSRPTALSSRPNTAAESSVTFSTSRSRRRVSQHQDNSMTFLFGPSSSSSSNTNMKGRGALGRSRKPRLTHFIEEPVSGRGFIKELCFSHDGRLIISPFAFGVRLLAFDPHCQELCDCVPETPIKLYEIATDISHTREVVSTKFSPLHYLFVAGCLNGRVSFHQPRF